MVQASGLQSAIIWQVDGTANMEQVQQTEWALCACKGAGLYLDTDTECWREGSDMLEGHDVVLQVGRVAWLGLWRQLPSSDHHPF